MKESHFNSVYWKKGHNKYTKLVINKANGKPRTIHNPSKRLKIIQRKALEKLQVVKKFQPRSHAHGFAQGKSIITNAAFHQKSKRIIKMDLKDFFPSIHFGRVRGMFMAYPFEFGEKAATIMAQLACLDDKIGILPQGGPLSPYIANMMCRRLDKKLAEVARSHRCHFTRYADDITFSTNDVSQNNINGLIKETSSIIESEGFVVNKDKTKILTPEERQVVTGIIINDGINVNRRYVRNLRATLRNCDKDGIESQIERKIFRDNRSSRPNLYASLYHPSKMKFEKSYNENKELYEYNPFFIEYLEEYYELDEDKDDEFLKTLSNKYISYTFDFRNKTYQIIMNYNFNDESFDYFLNAHASALPFDYLDTISRIYCVKYNCRNIYIDNHDNKEKFLDSLIPDKKEEEEKEKEKEKDEALVKKSIFYSKTKKTIKPKNKILNYSSNKFKYKGLLKEFSDLIFGFDIYDSSNNLVLNYFDLENQIFSVKKNDDYEIVQKEENFMSFKNFAMMSKT